MSFWSETVYLGTRNSRDMSTLTLSVPELGCEGCEDIVEGALTDTDGVEDASADYEAGRVVVHGDEYTTDAVMETVTFAGYDAEVASEETSV